MNNIFKPYDIRGLYPVEINEETVFKIAQAAVKFLNDYSANSGQAKKIIVGEDVRESSPRLAKKVIEAVLSAGCDVYFIGQTSAPVFYYAVNKLKADGGIMVTASHNGAEYNGLKISDSKGETIGLGEGLEKIAEIYNVGEFSDNEKRGQLLHNEEILEDYLAEIVELSGTKEGEFPFKIIADAGNGASALTVGKLFEKMKISYLPVYFEIDGRFSNRPTNPYLEGALRPLSRAVLLEEADLGIAFDVDGDRVALVDEKGRSVPASCVLYLLWKEMSGRLSKPKVVHGINYPKAIINLFEGRGIPSKQGRINFTKTMRESGAKIGGENSGHIFFPEMYYSECPELAVIKILQIMKESGKKLSELIGEIKNDFINSGEINIKIEPETNVENIFNNLKNKYREGGLNELDGITIDMGEWRFNLRAANTEPLIRLFLEAKTKELMEEKIKEITDIIKAA